MADKIPTAITILIGTGIVAILAGLNDQLGKFLAVFMVIVVIVWLVGGQTQTFLTKWEGLLSGSSGGGGSLL